MSLGTAVSSQVEWHPMSSPGPQPYPVMRLIFAFILHFLYEPLRDQVSYQGV
jgi:hypothetical protein